MAEQPKFPSRIHVLLAKEAPYGVVIRRGPSKQVCTVGWNRKDDTFQLGQWLKGRIYERRSDLSPDGRHLIYFAGNGRKYWTAISRAPYLKAIGFWPSHFGTWYGGGLFLDSQHYWVNDSYAQNSISWPSTSALQRAEYPDFSDCGGAYPDFWRLIRGGWNLINREDMAKNHSVTVFEKPNNNTWILRKLIHIQSDASPGKGVENEQHEMENSETGEKIDGADWEWADIDRHRLIWAEQGKLFAAHLRPEGIGEFTVLRNFNNMTFEALAAPY